jgi:hypothetical protein
MWKKIAIAGGTVALIGGIGTAALATSGSPSPHPSGSTANRAAAGQPGAVAKHPKLRKALERLKNFEHGTWVTAGKDASAITHTAFHGQVTAVSSTSITVKAKDATTQTFVINGDTKVHTRAQHKGAVISAVKSGDTVLVAGTGTPTVIAKQVVDTSR